MGSVVDPHGSFIVSFYDPQERAKDEQGRDLEAILKWPDEMLELRHDYIQILFPLPESSIFNSDAPPVTRTTFDAFRSRVDLRANLYRSFERIARFYGFQAKNNGSDTELVWAENWRQAFGNWVCRFDHNHLRITRIIRSLRVLGLEQEAQAFHRALLEVGRAFPHRISERSYLFWQRAAERPLHLAPDEPSNKPGIEWLRNWKEAQTKLSPNRNEDAQLKNPPREKEEAQTKDNLKGREEAAVPETRPSSMITEAESDKLSGMRIGDSNA